MTEQAQKSKKRTSLLTMLVIAILIALVGVQLIHLRSQIDDARSQLTARKAILTLPSRRTTRSPRHSKRPTTLSFCRSLPAISSAT